MVNNFLNSVQLSSSEEGLYSLEFFHCKNIETKLFEIILQ
jgi:hypothetical protein